ncbi:hypothetical protein PRUB_b1131 [Pseudoalteromonas rubra]|uniref:Uncharacterized protein n=1 Tax=Pseudoalteromonas rubra TaxID=43658 RepID=A0A8T0C1N7_9GAMM|nr:hypothetical protein PRUB_b1131 [Pseudoalteromonas rubra]
MFTNSACVPAVIISVGELLSGIYPYANVFNGCEQART